MPGIFRFGVLPMIRQTFLLDNQFSTYQRCNLTIFAIAVKRNLSSFRGERAQSYAAGLTVGFGGCIVYISIRRWSSPRTFWETRLCPKWQSIVFSNASKQATRFHRFSITKAYALASENVAKFPRLESREDAFSLFWKRSSLAHCTPFLSPPPPPTFVCRSSGIDPCLFFFTWILCLGCGVSI